MTCLYVELSDAVLTWTTVVCLFLPSLAYFCNEEGGKGFVWLVLINKGLKINISTLFSPVLSMRSHNQLTVGSVLNNNSISPGHSHLVDSKHWSATWTLAVRRLCSPAARTHLPAAFRRRVQHWKIPKSVSSGIRRLFLLDLPDCSDVEEVDSAPYWGAGGMSWWSLQDFLPSFKMNSCWLTEAHRIKWSNFRANVKRGYSTHFLWRWIQPYINEFMTPVVHRFSPRQPAGSGAAGARTHVGGGQMCEDVFSMKACVIHLLGGEVGFSIYLEVQAAF